MPLDKYSNCPGCGCDLLFQRRLAFIRNKYQGPLPAADVWLTDLKDVGIVIRDTGKGNRRYYVLNCETKSGKTWKVEGVAFSFEEAFRWLAEKLLEAAILEEVAVPEER